MLIGCLHKKSRRWVEMDGAALRYTRRTWKAACLGRLVEDARFELFCKFSEAGKQLDGTVGMR